MLLRIPEIELGLLIHPALGRGVEGNGKPHRHLRADARAAVQDRT